jgi:hypothetical protein
MFNAPHTRLLLLLAVFIVPFLSHAQGAFTPLTNLPGLDNVLESNSLPNLLNQIYRLCIGAAAVIAVLKIMQAGALHMFNKGSIAVSGKSRELIQNSVLGLLLVLSPAIVFGIINPDILDISLDFSKIQPNPIESGDITENESMQCTVYEGARPVRSDDLSNRCDTDAGEFPVSNRCCSSTGGVVLGSNGICCAKAAQRQYMLQYKYSENRSDGTTCVHTTTQYFATIGAKGTLSEDTSGSPGCDVNAPSGIFSKAPFSGLQIIKSCVPVTSRSVASGDQVSCK